MSYSLNPGAVPKTSCGFNNNIIIMFVRFTKMKSQRYPRLQGNNSSMTVAI